MYFRVPLILFLLASAAPSDANLFSRGSEHIIRSISTAHRHAVKRSSNLARDLRRALSPILVSQDGSSQSVYCVTGDGLIGSGGGSSSGSSGGSGSGGSASSKASGTSTASAASSSSSASSSPWKLQQNYEGDSFFNDWTFFTASDPTDGNVQYVDSSTASSGNLTGINSAGNAYMRVDTTQTVSGNRQSVRITTNYTFTQGLVVLDAVHAPTGCATWPAFWTDGPNWPNGGEIDIMEGVNSLTINQASIHTADGCTLPSSDSSTLGISGTVVGGTNCAAEESGDAGCGVQSSETNSFGSGFNAIGGGVYAMQWTDDGIKVWFFPRSSIPSDISNSAPQPSGWGTPLSFWPSTDCNMTTYFYDHQAIFDTTLCGQWAGDAWDSTSGTGQSQSCATMTGVSTCADYVANNGDGFTEAYWEVKSVKIYQESS
ncbi:glycoside hydrolase family 16 protein [Daedalea quercina L-15889]|uniref:Glycoside hydrolase family 16 protein n=1 Tax=Daedalea quercina L-15889 TaxID=1314783 RepID=A0A165P212_9APHY|nr:glycoside hydrolase family 16 protein [Daedalea quercina L-15889]